MNPPVAPPADSAVLPCAAVDSFDRILAGAAEVLAQGEALVSRIHVDHYSGRVPAALGGSIGSHYRHCLDHFLTLTRRSCESFVDFDRRDRDRRIETEPDQALLLTRELRLVLAQWEPVELARPVITRCEVSYSPGESPITHSTLGRELAYAVAHAIHHFAIIAILASLQQINLPPEFGMAPSTLAHLRNKSA